MKEIHNTFTFRLSLDNHAKQINALMSQGITRMSLGYTTENIRSIYTPERSFELIELHPQNVNIIGDDLNYNASRGIISQVMGKFILLELRRPQGSWFIIPTHKNYRFNNNDVIEAKLEYRPASFFKVDGKTSFEQIMIDEDKPAGEDEFNALLGDEKPKEESRICNVM